MSETHFISSAGLAEGMIAFAKSCGATIINDAPDAAGDPVHFHMGGMQPTGSVSARIYELPMSAILLSVDRVTSEQRERMFYRQRYGSPYLYCNYYYPRLEGEVDIAGFGELGHYASYYDIATNDLVSPSAALRELYGGLRKYVLLRSERVKFSRHPKSAFVESGLSGAGEAWNCFRLQHG